MKTSSVLLLPVALVWLLLSETDQVMVRALSAPALVGSPLKL
jgi:hypothetical protein